MPSSGRPPGGRTPPRPRWRGAAGRCRRSRGSGRPGHGHGFRRRSPGESGKDADRRQQQRAVLRRRAQQGVRRADGAVRDARRPQILARRSPTMPIDQPDLIVERYLRRLGGDRPDPGAVAFYASLDQMRSVDPTIADRVVAELVDQRANIKLIASENFSSLAVQQAMGNLLTDKYAEGYAGHRFYAGCDNVDVIESRGAELARELFGADHAYLQPHSGIDANLVAFIAVLATRVENDLLERLDVKNVAGLSDEQFAQLRAEFNGQRLLGMDYYSGGHLTHGYRYNISSRLFDARGYTVDRETGLLDLDAPRPQLHEVRPLILLAGYSAYTRKIDFATMRELADEVGATFMVDMAHFAGLVAGKVFTGAYDPVPHAHVVTSTTHKTLRGPRGGIVLSSADYADAVDKGCPAVLGGPLPHVMAAKALALKEASQPSFQEYAARIVDNARALA